MRGSSVGEKDPHPQGTVSLTLNHCHRKKKNPLLFRMGANVTRHRDLASRIKRESIGFLSVYI